MNEPTASTSAGAPGFSNGGVRRIVAGRGRGKPRQGDDGGAGRGRGRPRQGDDGGPGNRNLSPLRNLPMARLWQSATEWTKEDAELMKRNFYGYIDDADVDITPAFLAGYRPKLHSMIVLKQGGRHVVEDVAEKKELLTRGSTIPVQILCVDADDILHFRYYEEENAFRSTREMNPASVQRLLDEMLYYYEKETNKKTTSYKANGWVPLVGEVVVVAIQRYYYWEYNQHAKYNPFVLKDEFQRAKVLKVTSEGVTVDLLDDYGKGGILLENVYKIKPVFVQLSPQLFHGELAGLEFFQWKKLVHDAIMSCPIPNTDPDYTMNRVRVTFNGKYSSNGLPLVEVYLRQLSTSKWLSLKSHVLKNIRFSLSPFNNMLEGPAPCHVLRADEHANLWIQFRKDSEVLNRMTIEMEKLLPIYDSRQIFMKLTVEKILPSENEMLAKRNSQELYAARLEDKRLGRELFYRVKVISSKQLICTQELIRVFCIDYGIERVIPADKLQPLETICPDFCFVPPLAFKVHLHGIGSLELDHPVVTYHLFRRGELKVSLVYEWPSSAYSPDVNLFHITDDLTSHSYADLKDKDRFKKIDGVGKFLADNYHATPYSENEMKKMILQADQYHAGVQKMEGQKLKEDIKHGTGCIFSGENFQFSWPASDAQDETLDEECPYVEPTEEMYLSQNYWKKRDSGSKEPLQFPVISSDLDSEW